jgi:CRISPR-associated protein Cas1
MSFWLPILDPFEPPVRIMALHALAYCERLFYLEEVEEIRLADDKVFAGRQLHSAIESEDEGEAHSIEMTSTEIGLTGKVDCLKRRDGTYLPYEHKRGKARKFEDNTPDVWPSDRMQVIAYAVLIENTFGGVVDEGRVRYHTDNLTVRVPIDSSARADLDDALQRARQLRKTLDRPPVTTKTFLCEKCSLAPVCLPEETRFQQDPDRDTTRLFPPDREGTTIHVVTQGAKIGVAHEELIISAPGEIDRRMAIHSLESLMLHGGVQITSQALRRCADMGVGIHWLSISGHHNASLTSGPGKVQRRIRQYKALTDEATCLRLAKSLVSAKLEGEYRYILRATRTCDKIRALHKGNLQILQECIQSVSSANDADTLRGLEGMGAVQYFSSLRMLLNADIPAELRMDQRSRRPPLDRFNALLSFGYGLVHSATMGSILASGLEPAFGFLHTPRSAAYPLVLDIMELFRLPLWDIVAVGSVNRGQWDIVTDFEVTKAKVWLSDKGRKKAITLFEKRMEETWKHPVLNYSLTYARTIELEVRLLEKEWTGEPGLFGQSRLR